MKEYSVQDFEYDEIRVIIFDFDGTLYQTPNYKAEYIRYLLGVIDDLSYSDSVKKNPLKYLEQYGFINDDELPSFTENCEEFFSVYKPELDEYKLTHFYQPDYKNVITMSNEFLRKLQTQSHLVLVSNEVRENIEYKAEKLGIDLSVFDNLYCPSVAFPKCHTKYEIYKKIVNNYLADGTEIYAVGDRYKVDIEPLLKLGGAGLLVDDPKEAEKYLSQKFELN